jgi:hypothetical protein
MVTMLSEELLRKEVKGGRYLILSTTPAFILKNMISRMASCCIRLFASER